LYVALIFVITVNGVPSACNRVEVMLAMSFAAATSFWQTPRKRFFGLIIQEKLNRELRMYSNQSSRVPAL